MTEEINSAFDAEIVFAAILKDFINLKKEIEELQSALKSQIEFSRNIDRENYKDFSNLAMRIGVLELDKKEINSTKSSLLKTEHQCSYCERYPEWREKSQKNPELKVGQVWESDHVFYVRKVITGISEEMIYFAYKDNDGSSLNQEEFLNYNKLSLDQSLDDFMVIPNPNYKGKK